MSIADFENRCRKAADGMTFFGERVTNLSSDRLLIVIGHLYEENQMLKESLKMTSGLRGNLIVPRKAAQCRS